MNGSKKRSAPSTIRPTKKRKIIPNERASKKEKAFQRPTIPIPDVAGDDSGLSQEDVEFFAENAGNIQFLDKLDRNAIARSKLETVRLHRMQKPLHHKKVEDNLPSVHSAETDTSWGSDMEPHVTFSSDSEIDKYGDSAPSDSDVEQPYEINPRKRRKTWDSESEKENGIERLPIKLADGQIIKTGARPGVTEEESEEERRVERPEKLPKSNVATAARFGRPAVVNVISIKARKARIAAAKEQIAWICQDIVSEPENSLGLLRRLLSFSQSSLEAPAEEAATVKVQNDRLIRHLAFLSLLAVFKDVIPGYRIRKLTEVEKTEKVSQMIARTREWEQGLVGIYQQYLRILEKELKARTDLAQVSLKCLATLLVDVTHFNFSVNIMSIVVARLSKKSWDSASDLCLQTLVTVFKNDLTGVSSLEIVRLLNRMIKERNFNVHPDVLSCLLHLRLKTELGIRSSNVHADKPKSESEAKAKAKRAKGKAAAVPHLSKKAKKAKKEYKDIQKGLQEASAEVDKEDKANTQTETLKLLFVLYFSILKAPKQTPLLFSALQGVSRFAHLVNVDFFKDLLSVLKDLIERSYVDGSEATYSQWSSLDVSNDGDCIRLRLMCIVTAFELLTGQGEALDIDLNDFINHLYMVILPIALLPNIEFTSPLVTTSSETQPSSCASLLFRALALSLTPRFSTVPAYRIAAFAKRLLTAALSFPPSTALRSIEFVHTLMTKESQLEAMLNSDEKRAGGIYREDVDDPQMCFPFGTVFWELRLLEKYHWDKAVQVAAKKLMNYKQT